jgi:hypothetical protein
MEGGLMMAAEMQSRLPETRSRQERTEGMTVTMGQGKAQQQSEGTIARMIEEQTAKLPSDLFLWGAGAAIVGSMLLQCTGRKEESLFVGQWVPTLLILGVYNKIVKVAGSDRTAPGRAEAG